MNPLGDGRSKGNKAPESASSRGPSFDLYQAPSHMQLAVCITAVVILYMLYSYFQVRDGFELPVLACLGAFHQILFYCRFIQQLLVLTDLFLCFLVHQELIFRVEGFTYGWYLILVQFVLYSSLGYIDSAVSGESVRKYVSICAVDVTVGSRTEFQPQ